MDEIGDFFNSPLQIDEGNYIGNIHRDSVILEDDELSQSVSVLHEPSAIHVDKSSSSLVESKEIIPENIFLTKNQQSITEAQIKPKVKMIPINNKKHKQKEANINIVNMNEGLIKLPPIRTNSTYKETMKQSIVLPERIPVILPKLKNNAETSSTSFPSVSASFDPTKYLPTKTKEKIQQLKNEAQLAIKIARDENNFTNPLLLELIAKRIRKRYEKKIKKLLILY